MYYNFRASGCEGGSPEGKKMEVKVGHELRYWVGSWPNFHFAMQCPEMLAEKKKWQKKVERETKRKRRKGARIVAHLIRRFFQVFFAEFFGLSGIRTVGPGERGVNTGSVGFIYAVYNAIPGCPSFGSSVCCWLANWLFVSTAAAALLRFVFGPDLENAGKAYGCTVCVYVGWVCLGGK